MKTLKRYIITLTAVISFISSSDAQQLLSGAFSGSQELLVGVKYRNVRNSNSNQSDALYVGIPDLETVRSSGTRNSRSLNYTTAGLFTFSIVYDEASNSVISTTTINGTSISTTFSNVSSKLNADGKSSNPSNINLMRLKVRTQTGASSITISNVVIDGMSVNGTYGRSNSTGQSEWYTSSNLLKNGFTVSGTVTMSGNFANNADAQFVELDFGYTTDPGFGILPIEFNDFKIQQAGNGSNLLTWSTLHESNASHFEIQRSSDGQIFTTIGKVTAAGESNQLRSYTYTDRASKSATWYYRLLSADKDGRYTFSSVIKIKAAVTEHSATGLFVSSSQVRFQFQDTGSRMIRIYNLQGVMQQQVKTNEMVLIMSTSHFNSGNYIVQISNANGANETLRFIK
jgi:hypothetical protein